MLVAHELMPCATRGSSTTAPPALHLVCLLPSRRHHLPFPVLVIKPPHDPQHAKSAAEAHMQKGANTSKATTMAELRGEDSSPAEAAAQQGSAPLKVATIPGVGSVAPATPTAAAASQQG